MSCAVGERGAFPRGKDGAGDGDAERSGELAHRVEDAGRDAAPFDGDAGEDCADEWGRKAATGADEDEAGQDFREAGTLAQPLEKQEAGRADEHAGGDRGGGSDSLDDLRRAGCDDDDQECHRYEDEPRLRG